MYCISSGCGLHSDRGVPVSLNISSPSDKWIASSWVKPLGIAAGNKNRRDQVSGQPDWNEGVGCCTNESTELSQLELRQPSYRYAGTLLHFLPIAIGVG